MASIDVLKEWKKSNHSTKNIVVFVSDSLRWDCLPQSIARRGIVFKTVAASLFTASSFPSMITGLHPNNHGVKRFTDKLPINTKSLMNLDSYNTSLWNENTWLGYDPPESTPLHQLLRQDKRVPLHLIEPPFIYLEDDRGGHAPYGWNSEDKDYAEWEAIKFFRDYGYKGREQLVEKYKGSIDQSARTFKKRLDVIRERGLEQETLVIFTSDHGEALGEYGGHVGHGLVGCPEVVYVPTVFIHPALPTGLSFAEEGVMRHIDLLPTILDIIDVQKGYPVDGTSLVSVEKMPQIGYNHFESLRIRGQYRYKEVSVWDNDGGHMFRDNGFLIQLFNSLYKTLLCGPTSVFLRSGLTRKSPIKAFRDYLRVLKYFYRSYLKHGSPYFTKEDARIIIQSIESEERAKLQRTIKNLKRRGLT